MADKVIKREIGGLIAQLEQLKQVYNICTIAEKEPNTPYPENIMTTFSSRNHARKVTFDVDVPSEDMYENLLRKLAKQNYDISRKPQVQVIEEEKPDKNEQIKKPEIKLDVLTADKMIATIRRRLVPEDFSIENPDSTKLYNRFKIEVLNEDQIARDKDVNAELKLTFSHTNKANPRQSYNVSVNRGEELNNLLEVITMYGIHDVNFDTAMHEPEKPGTEIMEDFSKKITPSSGHQKT